MTFIESLQKSLILIQGVSLMAAAIPTNAFAALGEMENAIEHDRIRMSARRAVSQRFAYRIHTLETVEGARIQQYVGPSGTVFAVAWRGGFKPDLTLLLGDSGEAVGNAVSVAALRGGIQRHFRHAQGDLVVDSSAYLHRYYGFAYRPSMLPPGFMPASLGRD